MNHACYPTETRKRTIDRDESFKFHCVLWILLNNLLSGKAHLTYLITPFNSAVGIVTTIFPFFLNLNRQLRSLFFPYCKLIRNKLNFFKLRSIQWCFLYKSFQFYRQRECGNGAQRLTIHMPLHHKSRGLNSLFCLGTRSPWPWYS